jgi:RNA polymerase sigma-70 factor (ECF subfamily)
MPEPPAAATLSDIGRTLSAAIGWPHERRGSLLDADLQLVERCLAGEEAAWEDLVKVHTRRVYSICYRFTGSPHQAQDLTQEVFLRVFRSLKSFRAGEGSLTVWLGRLTRNLLIDGLD